MKRRIKIRRHGFVAYSSDKNLAKFQPNWSGGKLDLEFKMHAQLAQIFILRNKEKYNFDRNEISGT